MVDTHRFISRLGKREVDGDMENGREGVHKNEYIA